MFLYPAMTGGRSDLEFNKLNTTSVRARYLVTETAGAEISVNRRWNWLYHTNAVAKPCDMLDGLENKGILGNEYFGDVLTDRMYFTGMGCPDALAVAEFGVGIACYSTENVKGTVLGSFDFFGGGYTVNGFDIAGNAGSPAADRLLVNIVSHAFASAKDASPVSAEAQTRINEYFGIKG